MLTSSQWPGVLRFVSKHPTYVFVLAIGYTLLSVFCLWFVTIWKSTFPWTPPPPHPSEITAFESPLPLGISDDLPWGGGGVWIFSETTRSFLQYLVCIALSPANLISSCVSGCKDEKKVSFTAGHSRSCNYHVSGSYVCKKFPSWGRCTFQSCK